MGDAAASAMFDVNIATDAFEHKFEVGRLELLWFHFVAVRNIYDGVERGRKKETR